MGYDMRWRKADEAEGLAVAAATEVFNAACANVHARVRAAESWAYARQQGGTA